MFDNHTDLNNTVTCYFMHLIGLKVKVAANGPLNFFSTELSPALDEDKKDRWQEKRIWYSKKPLLIDS